MELAIAAAVVAVGWVDDFVDRWRSAEWVFASKTLMILYPRRYLASVIVHQVIGAGNVDRA